VRAGKYSHPITIQRNEPVKSDTGFESANWVDHAKVWGHIKGISGREWLSASVEAANVNYKVIIRMRKDIDDTMRILWEGPTLYIKAPLPNFDNWELEMLCEAVRPENENK